jgi:hypothetical protein
MATFKRTELVLDHDFDPVPCRHSINGWTMVLHCHHYSTLYTQLADDCGFMDARTLLAQVAEDSFYEVLVDYFEEFEIEELRERIGIAEQYFAALGLGKLSVTFAGPDAGEAQLSHSHVDQGWIKKWGRRDKPVNFIGCGYIAALFAAVFDRAPRAYNVREVQSIVCGSDKSKFEIVAK